ncbi:hypothetical protein NIES23_62490 (plasmid) [Trichormus variabilis NIES-23]|uniref:GTPase n=1 Tax=Trichormus variabilis NIES-23 TaxID=1973479 RepID=A0A1Z4KWK7_ANAVA|nr:hypothetical protein NIES23_62490 [Trichormus variabilis NIES-23]
MYCEGNINNFKTAEIAQNFKKATKKFKKLLEDINTPEISNLYNEFNQELKQHDEQGFLTVAFVGQYSAGKSTIISALTGRRDILIGADITTDQTASYDWNGIKLIDTPGLFTDRKDHDEITYEAIRQSDLLVFSLTYMLFDSITAENFKKLAYELGYRWKMMLVINKMADGAGEEEELIANYSKSLQAAIKPYTLDKLPVCFIDAKDYCEGLDEKDDFLVGFSRFQTFVEELNVFVKGRSFLAKFDTPVRIVLDYVDKAQLSLTRDSNKDSVFFELLHRLSRKVRQERERLRIKVRGIALRLSAAIAHEGIILANAIGTNEDIEALAKKAENNLEKLGEKASSEIEETVKVAIESFQQQIQEVLESDLAQAFSARLEVKHKVSTHNAESGTDEEDKQKVFTQNNEFEADIERLKQQIEILKQLGKQSQFLVKYAMKPGGNKAQGAFLRAGNVAGGKLHQDIYNVGKFLGFKFKPYGAVNLAKNIGNIAKALGPIIAVVGLAGDLYAKEQEEKQYKEIAAAKRDITSQFIAMGKDSESQIEAQLREIEAQIYGETENKITEERQKEEDVITVSNEHIKQLAEIRQDFMLILQQITNELDNKEF